MLFVFLLLEGEIYVDQKGKYIREFRDIRPGTKLNRIERDTNNLGDENRCPRSRRRYLHLMGRYSGQRGSEKAVRNVCFEILTLGWACLWESNHLARGQGN